MESNQDQRKGTRWTKRQDVRYHFYIILNYRALLQDGRKNRSFKDMHKYIPDRTSGQCRSHHQKKVKKKGSLQTTISKFYKQNYLERLLNQEHLMRELTYFIQQAQASEIIDEDKAKQLRESMRVNLQEFRLDEEQRQLIRSEKSSLNGEDHQNEKPSSSLSRGAKIEHLGVQTNLSEFTDEKDEKEQKVVEKSPFPLKLVERISIVSSSFNSHQIFMDEESEQELSMRVKE